VLSLSKPLDMVRMGYHSRMRPFIRRPVVRWQSFMANTKAGLLDSSCDWNEKGVEGYLRSAQVCSAQGPNFKSLPPVIMKIRF
jgi:hypothetical protein